MSAGDAVASVWDQIEDVLRAAGLAVSQVRPAAVTGPVAVLMPGATPWTITGIDGRTMRAGVSVVCFGPELQPLGRLAAFSADVGLALAAAGIRPGPPETIIMNADAGVVAITIPIVLTRSV
jgi:hypothetical protein